MTYNPTPADKFSFAGRTLGRVAQDPLGSGSRAPLDSHPLSEHGWATSNSPKIWLAPAEVAR